MISDRTVCQMQLATILVNLAMVSETLVVLANNVVLPFDALEKKIQISQTYPDIVNTDFNVEHGLIKLNTCLNLFFIYIF